MASASSSIGPAEERRVVVADAMERRGVVLTGRSEELPRLFLLLLEIGSDRQDARPARIGGHYDLLHPRLVSACQAERGASSDEHVERQVGAALSADWMRPPRAR